MVKPLILACFPGQGSQFVGMGQAWYQEASEMRTCFEEASDLSGVHLKKVCFEDPDLELHKTEMTQPCLLVTSVGIYRSILARVGPLAKAFAGHSLGEYSALAAQEAISLGYAAQWVKIRGKAMQEAVPEGMGGMCALLGKDPGFDEKVQRLCQAIGDQQEQTLEAANFNAPGQIVVSGGRQALDVLMKWLTEGNALTQGIKGIPLKVSAPFHSSYMAPAKEIMNNLFTQLPLKQQAQPLTHPYLPNVQAKFSTDHQEIFPRLVQQMDHPVLWKQLIQEAYETGFQRHIEFGPGKVLTGLSRRICGEELQTVNTEDPSCLKTLETWAREML